MSHHYPPEGALRRAGRLIIGYIEDRARRLRYGAAARRAMIEAIAGGQRAAGYRAVWIDAVAREIVQTLMKRSQEFNSRYPWDAISSNDQGDVLRNCLRRVGQE